MTFSFNLVLALFLLAPGFAVVAGVYQQSQIGKIKSPPPPPGSILTLALVSVGSLSLHFLGALFFALQDVWTKAEWPHRTVPFDPNVYGAMSALAFANEPMAANQVLLLLGSLLMLTIVGYWVGGRAIEALNRTGSLNPMLYGWLSEMAVAEDQREAVLAYVLSDVEEDGAILGYEGVVANMTTNADKEITSILLKSCETFYVRIGKAGVSRRQVSRSSPIPQMYLERSRIRNIAFEKVRFSVA